LQLLCHSNELSSSITFKCPKGKKSAGAKSAL
jgi:hypothetical protein